MKKITPILVLILVLVVIGISGYIYPWTNQPTNKFDSGEWRLCAEYFAVSHYYNNEVDDLDGNYNAYKENGTIILIGNGGQYGAFLKHDIKVVMENQGNNTKVSYYMDGKINSYELIKGFNADTVYYEYLWNRDNSTTITKLYEPYLTFDNSTPEATAVSIARLNEGVCGFLSGIPADASLTINRNYWIVKIHGGYDNWVVTVDMKTLMSKKEDGGFDSQDSTTNTWRSLDELKATYIAELQCDIVNNTVGKPQKIIMNGKKIWKVPIYNNPNLNDQGADSGQKLVGYAYVDLATGKSKGFTTEEWSTLKEVDDTLNKTDPWETPFKDALRDLYPE